MFYTTTCYCELHTRLLKKKLFWQDNGESESIATPSTNSTLESPVGNTPPITFPLEDPHLAMCPNFPSGPWRGLLFSLAAQGGISEDKAMDSQLSDAWKRLLTNKAEIELWDGELEERERVNDEAGLRAEVEELRKAEETQREAECE